MNTARFKEKMENLLRERRMTADEFLEKAKIHKSTYYNQFKNESIKLSFLQKIADNMKVPLTYFLDEPGKDQPVDQATRMENKIDQVLKNQAEIMKLLQKKSEVGII